MSGKIFMYEKDKIKLYKNVQKHFVPSIDILPLFVLRKENIMNVFLMDNIFR